MNQTVYFSRDSEKRATQLRRAGESLSSMVARALVALEGGAESRPRSRVPAPIAKPRRDPPGVKRGSEVAQPARPAEDAGKRERVDWDDSRPAPHVDVVDWKSWSTARPSERRKRWPAPRGGAGLIEPPSSGKEG